MSGPAWSTEEITETFFGLQDPASLVPAHFGSGYVWFASISPGLELPIDEYRVRRGR
ncbi:MAG: hypothetical protein GWM90_22730 [Gemmatimonadetes bacterium]|nr:hypothetical protein [Gemmatimonadota bacterium]NIQ57439.1 hypothetical protein [Gemmatimonadota bacterium]NIU77603.1 hypothetical protein [Gammaproteobacteria bacterium]NIX46790.1 hypothetical protein [Gemmatimonadota bacterium]NIY11144.1 hypothetical protein [Gemmatimonadota bacterium]